MNESLERSGGAGSKPEMTPARLEARMQVHLAKEWHGGEDIETALRARVGDGGPESPAAKFRAYLERTSVDLTKTDVAALREILAKAGIATLH
jgi:hypothetical protein